MNIIHIRQPGERRSADTRRSKLDSTGFADFESLANELQDCRRRTLTGIRSMSTENHEAIDVCYSDP